VDFVIVVRAWGRDGIFFHLWRDRDVLLFCSFWVSSAQAWLLLRHGMMIHRRKRPRTVETRGAETSSCEVPTVCSSLVMKRNVPWLTVSEMSLGPSKSWVSPARVEPSFSSKAGINLSSHGSFSCWKSRSRWWNSGETNGYSSSPEEGEEAGTSDVYGPDASPAQSIGKLAPRTVYETRPAQTPPSLPLAAFRRYLLIRVEEWPQCSALQAHHFLRCHVPYPMALRLQNACWLGHHHWYLRHPLLLRCFGQLAGVRGAIATALLGCLVE